MESLKKSAGKVFVGRPVGPATFSFVPVVTELPIKGILTKKEKSEGKSDKNVVMSHEKTAGGNVSEGELFKAEIVFIRDFVETEKPNIIRLEAEPQSPPDHKYFQTKAPPSVSAQSENTPNHTAKGTVSMETAVDKHRGISQQQCHNISGHAEDILACFAHTATVPEDRTSPTNSSDLFPTPASSRESILTSPASFSRTISPCPSVPSGVFTPSIVRIKKHSLAPGSSLVNIPQTCFSSCDSLSFACSQTRPPRHRPPVTRLSLLTAILRKGRLPVLTPALQRPYTPCWPVSPVTLSFCNACSAASSVASIPFEFSSRFSSSTSIDSQNHVCRELATSLTIESSAHNSKCPQTQLKRCNLRQKQVISPPPTKSKLPQTPLFSNVTAPSKHEKPASANPPCSSTSKLHELRPSNTHMLLKDHADNNLKNLISPPSKLKNEPPVTQNWTCQPNSSLLRLHMLSQQLRSAPVSPSPHSHIPPDSVCASPASPLSHLTRTTKVGRCESVGSWPVSRSITPSKAVDKTHCLSPSRYKPIVLSGWPSPATSPTPTPSPAPPVRDFTPSPSLSLSSTPSPRPGSGISDCSDREGKKRKTHKIKLSYKSLAAIPTNTILLDQQAIDEQVEQNHCNSLDRPASDTHSEMCSPAELRQKSEELYAVIDEILANSIPEETSKSLNTNVGFQHNSSLSKSLGRETKYASLCSLHPSASKERNLMYPKKTKPGVIRPMTAIPRLTVKDEDEFQSSPYRQVFKQTSANKKKVGSISRDETDLLTSSKGRLLKEEMMPERRGLFSVCELYIKEPDEQISPSGQKTATSFSAAEKNMAMSEACI
ncbi:muscular LMNA-interacting protein [Kryptolebias marmoratus]|uniref:Muscular LMNA interacting protein n=1 Tax=Kryptolebias marmoratus TaxID=37003 RepID=A0A3Q3BA96_KRYMA|nr:muscular LMNA-interacting protein [Kryptolebias marmoratus]